MSDSPTFWSGASLRRGLRASALMFAAGVMAAWMGTAARAGEDPDDIQGEPLDAAPKATPAKGNYAVNSTAPFPQQMGTPAKVIPIDENPEVKTVQRDGKNYFRITFGLLANYKYRVPNFEEMKATDTELPAKFKGQIPKDILAMKGKEVAVQGFMVPLEIEKGRVKSFVLVRNQMLCCYGNVPQMNEWIYVTMEGDNRAPFFPDVPVTAYGKFEAGEDINQGTVVSIYRMAATAVDLPKDL